MSPLTAADPSLKGCEVHDRVTPLRMAQRSWPRRTNFFRDNAGCGKRKLSLGGLLEVILVTPSAPNTPTSIAARDEAGDALLKVCGRSYPQLVRLALLMTGRLAEAEDVVQEALARCYDTWTRRGLPDHPEAYLRRAVATRAQTGRWRQFEKLTGYLSPRPVRSAEDAALESGLSPVLAEALLELPGRQRQCVILRHVEQLSVTECAAVLRIGEATVRTHTHRGLQRLAAALDAELNSPLGPKEAPT